MTERQFDKLKAGSIIKNNITDEIFNVVEKDAIGVLLNDEHYYTYKELIDYSIIKK